MSQFSPEPPSSGGELPKEDLFAAGKFPGDPSDTPVGDKPTVPDVREEPPDPTQPPASDPPLPHHPEDPPPAQQPPRGDPPTTTPPLGDPPRSDAVNT